MTVGARVVPVGSGMGGCAVFVVAGGIDEPGGKAEEAGGRAVMVMAGGRERDMKGWELEVSGWRVVAAEVEHDSVAACVVEGTLIV